MRLYRIKHRGLRWFYRIAPLILIPLWIWALTGLRWYWWPTTIGATLIYAYFGLSAWVKG